MTGADWAGDDHMAMRNLAGVFLMPLAIELINHTVDGLIREPSNAIRLQAVDIISIFVTVAVLIYLGWRVAMVYAERRLLKAAGFGITLWFVSTVIFTGGIQLVQSLVGSTPSGSPFAGPLIAFTLFAPMAAATAVLGAYARIKTNQSA